MLSNAKHLAIERNVRSLLCAAQTLVMIPASTPLSTLPPVRGPDPSLTLRACPERRRRNDRKDRTDPQDVESHADVPVRMKKTGVLP
jgi:hypothetical protein